MKTLMTLILAAAPALSVSSFAAENLMRCTSPKTKTVITIDFDKETVTAKFAKEVGGMEIPFSIVKTDTQHQDIWPAKTIWIYDLALANFPSEKGYRLDLTFVDGEPTGTAIFQGRGNQDSFEGCARVSE